MSQYTNNVLTAPDIFNINDSNRTFVQPVKNQENPPNSQNTVYVPKIKIKDLKELQDPGIAGKTERNKCISDLYFNVLNSNTDNSLVNTKEQIFIIADQNRKNDHSYAQKSCYSQNTSDKLTYYNLDIWLKERSEREKLEKKQNLIEKLRNEVRFLFKNNQTYSLSKPNSKSSIPERNQNPILEDRDNENLDMISCINNSLPISHTKINDLFNTTNSINPYNAINNVGVTNRISQNCVEEISNLPNSINPYNAINNVGVTNRTSQNFVEEISNLPNIPNIIDQYNAINNVGVANNISQNCVEAKSNLPNTPTSINPNNAINNVCYTNNISQNCVEEISNLPNIPNIIDPYNVINNVGVTNHISQNCGKEFQNCFEFICLGESSYVEVETDITPDPVVSLSTSSTKNVNESVQNSVAGKCDYETRQVARLNFNMKQSHDYESRTTAGLNSSVNQSQDHESRQTAGLISNVSQSQDHESRQTAGLNSDVNQLQVPSIEISDEVDSTCLRNGIINAAKTIISTEKLLKSLLHNISRTTSLPPKQAISLLRRFKSISKSFNQGLHKIDKNVENEYKHLFSNSLVKEQEMKENHKQDIETIPKESENCGTVDVVNEQPNAFIYKNKWQSLNIEQSNTISRKRRRQRSNKSDDEELDKSFQPAVEDRNIVTSRRYVPHRSCRKRHISPIYEPEEFENEADRVIF